MQPIQPTHAKLLWEGTSLGIKEALVIFGCYRGRSWTIFFILFPSHSSSMILTTTTFGLWWRLYRRALMMMKPFSIATSLPGLLAHSGWQQYCISVVLLFIGMQILFLPDRSHLRIISSLLLLFVAILAAYLIMRSVVDERWKKYDKNVLLYQVGVPSPDVMESIFQAIYTLLLV